MAAPRRVSRRSCVRIGETLAATASAQSLEAEANSPRSVTIDDTSL